MSNVYRNLKESPFMVTTENGFTFVFSSQFNLARFGKDLIDHRQKIKLEFESRFRIKVDLNNYADFILYKEKEKRGFLVKTKNKEELTCLESVKLDGEIKTLKSSKD